MLRAGGGVSRRDRAQHHDPEQAMTIEAMERHRTALAKLRRLIDDGACDGTGRLPPERTLAEALGVGRRTLRRALDVLEAEGRIRRHQGQGTFIATPGTPREIDLGHITEHTNPIEVMEVRLAVEPVIARLASLRASRCDIERLARLAETTRTAANAADYARADAAFHRRIAEAARNGLFLAVYDALNAIHRDASWAHLGETAHCFKRQAAYARFHQEIAEAIAARDSERAEEAMFSHLSDVQGILFQSAFPQVHAVGGRGQAAS